jgi:hypothetical protein
LGISLIVCTGSFGCFSRTTSTGALSDVSALQIAPGAKPSSGPAPASLVAELIPSGSNTDLVFAGLSAGSFDPNKAKNWNPYAFPKFIPAENIYATELVDLGNNQYRLFYGGTDTATAMATDLGDRIFSATSNNFLGRSSSNSTKFDFSAPTWVGRRMEISTNPSVGVGYNANDPTVVAYPDATGATQYLMLFSVAAPDLSTGAADDRIGYATTSTLGTTWNPGTMPLPDSALNGIIPNPLVPLTGRNIIQVSRLDAQGALHYVHFVQRPALVYRPDQRLFYLYYDQGGIAQGRDLSTYPDCQPAETQNDCTQNGGTVHVATSTDGINYMDMGLSLGGVFGGSAGVKYVNGSFVMFTDTDSVSLSMSTSSDGLRFTSVLTGATVNYHTPNVELVTNITPIIRGTALSGVIVGSFPEGALQSDGTYKCPGYQAGNFCIDEGYLNAFFLQRKVEFTYNANGVATTLNAAIAYDEDRIRLTPPATGWAGLQGKLTIYDTDGTTVLYTDPNFKPAPGSYYTFTPTK